MVEVDPRLFVTCRLCLEVEGQFQIVPCVQDHIKFCFDIDVEPFDRLPQLICRKCDSILKEYYAIKKNFKEKQEELKAKIQNNAKEIKKSPLPQQEGSDNSSSNEGDDVTTKKRKHKTKRVKKKRVINRLQSSSCDELDNNSHTSQSIQSPFIENEKPEPWEEKLNKYFVCRICSQKFRHKEDIKKHINVHKYLEKKYKNVFNMSCLVVMEKFDGKPNLTNSNNNVVYNSDSIIQNKHNHFFYVVYQPINHNHNSIDYENEIKSHQSNAESTDSEILSCKRRRIISRSSSETVVINRNQDTSHPENSKSKSPTVIDCIAIDDSSDSRSEKSNGESQSSSIKSADCKTIDNIIKMCYNRYAKRIVFAEKKKLENDKINESVLQRKVLSIGRKIINYKGVHSTGILRYMEYKDLNVIWKESNTYNNANMDSKYVRVSTRMQANDVSLDNNLNWKKFNAYSLIEEKTQKYNMLSKVKNIRQLNTVKQNDEHLPRISSVFSHLDLEISKVESDNQLQKLLNPNPVLNPKQMPKKANEASTFINPKQMPKNANEASTFKITKVFSAANQSLPCYDSKETDKNIEINRSMPILTSAISLSSVSENNAVPTKVPTEDSSMEKQQVQYPRIKVKPVSELMPEKPINTIQENNHSDSQRALRRVMVWPNQNVLLSTQDNHENSVNGTSQFSNPIDNASEYIVLDTVEFPNTRTNSPFKYLKDLFLVHNITLLDTDAPLPANAVCLIKLKLIYQQEKSEPLSLSLSLYCCGSIFCIKVRDMQQRDINVGKLSANWQWQLLKIYNNEVAKKVLITAKRISDETHHYTKNFFTLLNTVRFTQDVCNVNLISM